MLTLKTCQQVTSFLSPELFLLVICLTCPGYEEPPLILAGQADMLPVEKILDVLKDGVMFPDLGMMKQMENHISYWCNNQRKNTHFLEVVQENHLSRNSYNCLQEVIFISYLFSIKQFEPFILQIYNFRHYSDSIHVTNLE